MTFTLPALPYAYDYLEPVIDAQTMEIHHSKHHQAYVDNLNKAVQGTEYAEWKLEDLVKDYSKLPEDIQKAVRNNGGGHFNHSLFWTWLTAPKEDNKPSEEWLKKLEEAFGSFEAFQEKFEKAGAGQFGSGWAWLVDHDGTLEVVSTPNQDNPLTDGKLPLLGVDVWEHAYYLKYKNARPKYLQEFWKVVNWEAVEKGYQGVDQ